MASFEHALNAKVTLRQGEKETIVTKFAAGIEQLVTQFAKGDRHARRDFLQVADRLGILEGLRKAMNKKAREEIRRITPDMSDEEAAAAYEELIRHLEDDDPET
jgi:hypothetical protein